MSETEYWEFLIQKEGDRSWLPLESPDVEILEGRYRIVARSHRKNSHVEVRITHQAIEEVPPKRRTQKRSHRTTADGLIVVIPYTSMKPGTWELSCSGDLMADLMGNGWQASVQLHVVPKAEEDLDDWEPDWQTLSVEESAEESVEDAEESPSQTDPEIESPVANSSVDRLRQIAEQMSDQMSDQTADELQNFASETPEDVPGQAIVPVELPPLQITLTQETFVAHRGQTLTLTGQVMPCTEDLTESLRLSSAEFKVSLRDPQSSEVLLETCELLLNQPLPIALAFELRLPANLRARLLLGELALYDLTQNSEAPAILASQSFTLTADATELLESVSDERAIDEDELDRAIDSAANPSQEPPKTSQLNLSFLNLVDTPKPEQPLSFKPIADQPLPPQIHHPSSQEGKKSLDLPSFLAPTPELEPSEEFINQESNDSIEAELTQLELAIESEDASIPSPQDEPPLLPPAKTSPVQSAFQALKLQDRFFSRLNSLASDAELSEELKAAANPFAIVSDDSLTEIELPESDSSDAEVLEPEVLEPEVLEPEEPPADLDSDLTQEVVVDDERFSLRQQKSQPAPNPLLLTDDESVPTPILEIATEELIAGRSLVVRAKLPNLLPKFYVKLWINDRQTRALLDGPRWLVDFNPNGLGDLEASTQLTVPFGSLEIQLEAIAVEVSTQRESHKVVVDRAVIPPDLPDLSLDDFEV